MQTCCILRLSALGDIVHVVGVVQMMQRQRPDLRITWIIGKTEYQLYGDLPGIEFIVFDKKQGWRSYLQLYKQLRGRRFDALFHMQTSIRASFVSLCISADSKLGFDYQRAVEWQWLFTNRRIPAKSSQHLMDLFAEFPAYFNITGKYDQWQMPISDSDREWAQQCIGDRITFIVAPSASTDFVNWPAERFAAVINHIQQHYGYQVILIGSNSEREHKIAARVEENLQQPCRNLVGKTTLKQMYALIAHASAVLSPDTGPAHFAVMANTPVIALYAVTNPGFSGAYRRTWIINSYPEAMQLHFGDNAAKQPWSKRIKEGNRMEIITVPQVIAKVDQLCQHLMSLNQTQIQHPAPVE